MSKPASRFSRTLALVLCAACVHDEAFAAETAPSDPKASTSQVSVSAEQISKTLNPYRDSVGPVVQRNPTPLGELAWIDSGGDRRPDTLTLNGKVIVPPRKAEDGSSYGLHEISWEGYEDQKTGEYGFKRLLITQSDLACQHILLDFTGPEVWVSPRFPEERQFRGADQGCVDVTWVKWDPPYPLFYLGGSEYPLVFGYNAKLKAVIGPVEAPPPPKCQSLVPQPFGAIEECMATERKRKQAKSQARPKVPS
jgi:hypothetical protein